jgi:hypothetical protein
MPVKIELVLMDATGAELPVCVPIDTTLRELISICNRNYLFEGNVGVEDLLIVEGEEVSSLDDDQLPWLVDELVEPDGEYQFSKEFA